MVRRVTLGRRWLSVRLVQQMEAAECGVACLAMLLEHHGHHRTLPELRATAGTSRDGNSALELLAAARFFGLEGRGVSIAPEDLAALRAPAILHWELNHFVVLEFADQKHVRIVVPANGRRSVNREVLTPDCVLALPAAERAGEIFQRNPLVTLHLDRYISERQVALRLTERRPLAPVRQLEAQLDAELVPACRWLSNRIEPFSREDLATAASDLVPGQLDGLLHLLLQQRAIAPRIAR